MAKTQTKKNSGGAKEKWYDLGTLRKPKDKDKNSYIVLDKNVEILVGGKPVDLGDYRTIRLMDPFASLDSLLEGGHIDEPEHQKRTDALTERNVKYKLTVPPAASAEDSE